MSHLLIELPCHTQFLLAKLIPVGLIYPQLLLRFFIARQELYYEPRSSAVRSIPE